MRDLTWDDYFLDPNLRWILSVEYWILYESFENTIQYVKIEDLKTLYVMVNIILTTTVATSFET